MNALSRPLWAALGLMTVILPGFAASAQFLNPDVIQAQQITADMRQQIQTVVAPAMAELIGFTDKTDAKNISQTRKKLLDPMESANATPAFLDAFSETITAKMDRAVNHDSELVRMNAMILLSRMTDDGSLPLINAGLEDKSVAVERWAMEALRRRVTTWKTREQAGSAPANLPAKLTGVVNQINAKIAQKPHPIVVAPALLAYLAIDTDEAKQALIDQLGKRIELHAGNPSLSYAAEQAAMERFAQLLVVARKFNQDQATGLNRVAFRYAKLILEQAKADKISNEHREDALSMLNQCFTCLGQVAAGAQKNAPAGQAQANGAIINGQWQQLDTLLNDWAGILRAAPFSLTDADLGL